MVSVSEATSIIESHLYSPKTENVALSDALNRILGEAIMADRDLPPFNRVAMDGIAIQFEQFKNGRTAFPIEGVAAAGQPQKTLLNSNQCYEVMTGAPLPINTDTVIRYEDIEVTDNDALITIQDFTLNLNVHGRGQDAKKGDLLLSAGTKLSPAEIALIAAIGKSSVLVKALPNAAIISTGDELVGIDEVPAAHQIRRSNSYTLQAALKSLHCESSLYHLPDEKKKLTEELTLILDKHDLIILSGGVSKGKFDFIPEALEHLGVKKHFHRVKQKPGKPLWFGSTDSKTVFALPGNPVSATMCFYKYIKPWVLKSLGTAHKNDQAILNEDFEFNPDLTYFLESHIENDRGKLIAHPKPGGGSGDFANLKEVNGFMELPIGRDIFKKGQVFPIYLFRE